MLWAFIYSFNVNFEKKVHRINLSFSSALTTIPIVHSLIISVCQVDRLKKQMKSLLHINGTISSGEFITYYFTIAVLTLDRLVCLVNPVKYTVRWSKAKKDNAYINWLICSWCIIIIPISLV